MPRVREMPLYNTQCYRVDLLFENFIIFVFFLNYIDKINLAVTVS